MPALPQKGYDKVHLGWRSLYSQPDGSLWLPSDDERRLSM